MTERKKALVVGATGVVGRRLAEYIDGLDSWEVVGLSRRAAIAGDRVLRISVDLSNREETEAALRHLDDVTHIFYEARFDHAEGEAESIEVNTAMFRNLIDAIVPIAQHRVHVHVGSGQKIMVLMWVRHQRRLARVSRGFRGQVSITSRKITSATFKLGNYGRGRRRDRPAFAIRHPASRAA